MHAERFQVTIDETMEMARKWNYGRLGTTIWRECNRVLQDKSTRSPKAVLIAVNTVCPIVIKSWRDNWERLTEYFQYTPMIRKLIYTTNTLEGYHRQVRKVTKNKGVYPTDTALEKLVFLAYRNIPKKWTMPLANWGQISQQLAIKFGDRFKLL